MIRRLAIKAGVAHVCHPLETGETRCGACGRGRLWASQSVCLVCKAEI